MYPHARDRVMIERTAYIAGPDPSRRCRCSPRWDRLAGMATPAAVVDGLDKRCMRLSTAADLRSTSTLHTTSAGAPGAQGGVQHRALLGEVDAFAAETGVAHGFQFGFACQLHQVFIVSGATRFFE